MKNAYFPKKIKQVTRMPNFLLHLKGRWDSRHGDGTCKSRITIFHKKMIFLESQEVIAAENALFPARKEAAIILAALQEQQKKISGNGTPDPGESPAITVDAIRRERRGIREREDAKMAWKDSVERLSVIHETIINVNTILDERINKIRSSASVKIHAYITGIRKGKLKDFDFMAEEDDSARRIYEKKHQELDRQIAETVLIFRRGNTVDKEDVA